MSLTVSLQVQYNNNVLKTLTGIHSSKGLDYTTENEVNEWLLQLLTQMQGLEDIKPHKNLYITMNGSYCNNKVHQNRATIAQRVQFIDDIHQAQINAIEIFNIVREAL